jgi:hypothetical protein
LRPRENEKRRSRVEARCGAFRLFAKLLTATTLPWRDLAFNLNVPD